MIANIWLGLFSGIAFGFVIQRVGATNPDKMARAHLMLEPEIPQFMLLTVALSALGLLGLQAAGEPRTVILPTSIVATGIAAILFGIGWGLTGYCPGTCWAAAGEGRMDAIFTLFGGLAGTAVFAQFHESLIPLLYLPSSVGPVTLTDWFGSRALGAWILAFVLALCVWGIGKLWGRRAPSF
jgi:uncharacterized membrane protein YedE/YeeE